MCVTTNLITMTLADTFIYICSHF